MIFILFLPSTKLFSLLPVGVVGNSQQPGTDDNVSGAEKATVGETSDKGVQATSAVIGNIPETPNFEFLEMLIENILDSSSPSFTLELLPDTPSAAVTFQSEQGKRPFLFKAAHEQGILLVYVFLFILRDL